MTLLSFVKRARSMRRTRFRALDEVCQGCLQLQKRIVTAKVDQKQPLEDEGRTNTISSASTQSVFAKPLQPATRGALGPSSSGMLFLIGFCRAARSPNEALPGLPG